MRNVKYVVILVKYLIQVLPSNLHVYCKLIYRGTLYEMVGFCMIWLMF